MQDIQAKMERELTKALDACEAEVLALIAPLERLAEAAVERAEGHARRRGELAARLQSLKQRVANVE